MYAKSTRPSAKRADQIARPRRVQTCKRSELRAKRAMRMCPPSGQIFKYIFKIYFYRGFKSMYYLQSARNCNALKLPSLPEKILRYHKNVHHKVLNKLK